jgi:superfamily II DNA/RNA helicase
MSIVHSTQRIHSSYQHIIFDMQDPVASTSQAKSGKGTWQTLGESDLTDLAAPNRPNRTGVDPIIAKALTQRGFKTPTPIQRASIPLLIGSPPRDVLGMARTGSGKTFAYIIPLLQRLISPDAATSRALILIPTRELALQVMIAGKDLSRGVKRRGEAAGKPLRWGLIMGGDALDKQFELMESKPDMYVLR